MKVHVVIVQEGFHEPSFHSFAVFGSYEKAVDWILEFERQNSNKPNSARSIVAERGGYCFRDDEYHWYDLEIHESEIEELS